MAHVMAPVTLQWLVNELSGRQKPTTECDMMFNDFVGDVRIGKVHNHQSMSPARHSAVIVPQKSGMLQGRQVCYDVSILAGEEGHNILTILAGRGNTMDYDRVSLLNVCKLT